MFCRNMLTKVRNFLVGKKASSVLLRQKAHRRHRIPLKFAILDGDHEDAAEEAEMAVDGAIAPFAFVSHLGLNATKVLRGDVLKQTAP